MAVLRRDSVATVGGGSSQTPDLPAREVGDLLFAFVGGGNQVTSHTAVWESVAHVTGVEAQGELLWKIAEGGAADSLTLGFDGTDPHRIVVASHYSSDGYAVDHQVVFTGQQGWLSGVLAPATFTTTQAAHSGNVTAAYVFTRNGNTVADVTPGTLLHSWDFDHAFGYWEDTRPHLSDTITFNLPERTGHFRAVVRFFEWEWTDWQDTVLEDAAKVQQGIVYSNPTSDIDFGTAPEDVTYHPANGYHRYGDTPGTLADLWDELFTHLYAGDTTDGWDRGGVRPRLQGYTGTTPMVAWEQVWRPLTGTALTVTSATLPDDVYTSGDYVDPLVYDVEWEPTDTPAAQSIQVNIQRKTSGAGIDQPGEIRIPDWLIGGALQVRYADTPPATWLTPSEWSPIPVAFDIPITSGNVDTDTAAAEAFTTLYPTGEGTVWFSIVDSFSTAGTIPPVESMEALITPWRASLFGHYTPRYRLRREVTTALSVIRQWPRDDGQGLTTTPRHWPPTKARRTAGGYR